MEAARAEASSARAEVSSLRASEARALWRVRWCARVVALASVARALRLVRGFARASARLRACAMPDDQDTLGSLAIRADVAVVAHKK